MEDSSFLIYAAVFIGTHIIRTVYEILKHRKFITANKTSFVIIFINMALLWMTWFMMCVTDSNRIALPVFLNYTGIAIIIAGGLVFFAGLLTIKTLESYDGDLITKGIYSRLRHPMYTGFILWLTGGPLIFGALIPAVLAPFFISNVLYWRHLEELELVKRFASYAEYKKSTLF